MKFYIGNCPVLHFAVVVGLIVESDPVCVLKVGGSVVAEVELMLFSPVY